MMQSGLRMTVCCLALAARAFAQTPQPGPAEMPGRYAIRGVLANALSGEPVPRATIEALRDEDGHVVATTITDSEGRFSLDHLAASKYELSAMKRGFLAAFYDQHDEFSSAIVTGPDQDTTHLNFKLAPAAILRGTVTSDDGDPVADARIMLFQRSRYPRISGRVGPRETTMTDDTGAYEFTDLDKGEYLLAVIAEPWYALHEGAPEKRNAALDVVYPVTYFDSTTDEASASPISLGAGSREEANISLHAVAALHLTVPFPRQAEGSVQPPQLEQTIFGVTISSVGESSQDPFKTGTMEMDGIAPGHYQLTQGDPARIVDLDLSASGQVDPTGGNLANIVAGRLRMLSGAPAPDEATVSLQRIDNNPGQYIYASMAHHGQFKFDEVPPGEWTFAVTSGNRALSVVSIAAGGPARQAGDEITLRERTPELLVTLSDSETDVKGFASKDGKGFAGAMIVLLPRNPAQWRALTRRDQSDSDGSFVLHNVAPGDYTLVAIADGWELDWTNAEAMARYLTGGTNVRVTESSGKLVLLSAPVKVEER